MNVLVVGYGSIGARHAEVLAAQKCRVAIVSSRDVAPYPTYRSLSEAMADFATEYVVVANRTSEHYKTLQSLSAASFAGTVLVEKPLFDSVERIPDNCFAGIFVGYNLRFHPLLQRLREVIADEAVISLQAYVGQYLPDWRPGRDYRTLYSARRAEGGGVLRDLSHELDYLNWMLGGWTGVIARGGHFSDLEIDTEDAVASLIAFGRCPLATLQMNYLDRAGRRSLVMNTSAHTIKLDLINASLVVDCERETFAPTARNHTYASMHAAIMDGDIRDVCTAEEAMDVLKLIAAIESSMTTPRWVAR